MLTITIVMCSWCGSPRPIDVHGIDRIPPGLHDAKVQISHGMCVPCDAAISGETKGGTTHSGTSARDNATEEKKGC